MNQNQTVPGINGNGALPAAEAFCTGGAWHAPQTWGIRFIQDPCNTIQHPFPF